MGHLGYYLVKMRDITLLGRKNVAAAPQREPPGIVLPQSGHPEISGERPAATLNLKFKWISLYQSETYTYLNLPKLLKSFNINYIRIRQATNTYNNKFSNFETNRYFIDN